MTNFETETMDRIADLPDEELLRIIQTGLQEYRPEAIGYARGEAARRGISISSPYTTVNQVATDSGIVRKISQILHSKVFWLGFVIGVFPLIVVNFVGYDQLGSRVLWDDSLQTARFGFPLDLYQLGYFHATTKVLWYGLMIDIIVICGAGVLLGALCHHLFGSRHYQPDQTG